MRIYRCCISFSMIKYLNYYYCLLLVAVYYHQHDYKKNLLHVVWLISIDVIRIVVIVTIVISILLGSFPIFLKCGFLFNSLFCASFLGDHFLKQQQWSLHPSFSHGGDIDMAQVRHHSRVRHCQTLEVVVGHCHCRYSHFH